MNTLLQDHQQANLKEIDDIWQNVAAYKSNDTKRQAAKDTIWQVIEAINHGVVTVCYKEAGKWRINQQAKKAILLMFQFTDNSVSGQVGDSRWYDKVPTKFAGFSQEDFLNFGARVVPGAFVRQGCYIGKGAVIMPSFVNIGSYIGDKTMIDSLATIGSCCYIGKGCHVSSNTVIGGVLEPLQASPVIIEDNCFIGAGSTVLEGILVEEGAVIANGVSLSASTKIVDYNSGVITYGRVPAYSVIIPGSLPNPSGANLPAMSCAVLYKKVDKSTRSKTSINDLLR